MRKRILSLAMSVALLSASLAWSSTNIVLAQEQTEEVQESNVAEQEEEAEYGTVNPDAVLDAYIAEKITGKGLTGENLVVEIARFSVGYDYLYDGSDSNYTWEEMIINNGGFCWGKTSAVAEICSRIGIDAWVISDYSEYGYETAYENPHPEFIHKHVMIKLDGVYYEVKFPCYEEQNHVFSYWTTTDKDELFSYDYDGYSYGYTVTQYKGDATDSTLTIPVNPYYVPDFDVTRIVPFFDVVDPLNYVEIKLPSTLREIEHSAFFPFANLEKLEIPANVRFIGDGAFARTKLDEGFSCSKDNPYFVVEDGVLYNKNKTELVAAPATENVNILDTVETISPSAFSYNRNIESVTVPSSVNEIGNYAFSECDKLKYVDLSKTDIDILYGDETGGVFTDTQLEALILPDSLKCINDGAFARLDFDDMGEPVWTDVYPKYIYGSKGSYAEQYANEHGIAFREGHPDDYIVYEGYSFYEDKHGDKYCFDSNGNKVINEFKCDGTYTYYFQADGTAMRDRLTYHPDGVHVIYFDEYGHEVFSNFHAVKKSIEGNAVNDLCFFDVYGYMYVDVMTYGNSAFGNGDKIYYINPYGVIERNGWFGFSETCVWAGTDKKVGTGIGYANADGSLMINQHTYYNGNLVYMQGDGHIQ